jgi:RNA polymerase sigma factor (sigma-70 family)
LDLVRRVQRGDLDAWHEFVDRFAGLILSISRRYLFDDDDDARNTCVATLECLYRSGLERYDGRAALSTFVMTVARSRALDALRHLYGRKRPPAFLNGAAQLDQDLYRLYYIEGQGSDEIRARLGRNGRALAMDEYLAALDRLDERLDPRLRSRLAYDLHARTVGAISGRMLELMKSLQAWRQGVEESMRPDALLLETRTRALLEQIQACVENLDDDSRQAVHLHYYEGLNAKQIADEMQLPGPRRAYKLLERAIVKLRRMLTATGAAPAPSAAAASPTNSPEADAETPP